MVPTLTLGPDVRVRVFQVFRQSSSPTNEVGGPAPSRRRSPLDQSRNNVNPSAPISSPQARKAPQTLIQVARSSGGIQASASRSRCSEGTGRGRSCRSARSSLNVASAAVLRPCDSGRLGMSRESRKAISFDLDHSPRPSALHSPNEPPARRVAAFAGDVSREDRVECVHPPLPVCWRDRAEQRADAPPTLTVGRARCLVKNSRDARATQHLRCVFDQQVTPVVLHGDGRNAKGPRTGSTRILTPSSRIDQRKIGLRLRPRSTSHLSP